MSRVTLSGLANPAGTGAVTVAAGHSVYQPGMIVQTVYARTDARTTYASANSGNGTTVTDLNLTITPKFQSSLLLMTWMINCEFGTAAWDNVWLIHKGGALITTTGYTGYNSQAGNLRWSGFVGGQYDNNAASTVENYRIQYFIPALTATSQTFAPAVRSASGTAHTLYLNRTVSSAGADDFEVTISTGIIQEIAQ